MLYACVVSVVCTCYLCHIHVFVHACMRNTCVHVWMCLSIYISVSMHAYVIEYVCVCDRATVIVMCVRVLCLHT